MRKTLLAAVLAVVPAGSSRAAGPAGKEILEAAGVRGGLVVHLGCRSGEVTAGLYGGEGFVVHGLCRTAADAAAAREYLRRRGLTGPVSVAVLSGRRLPYVDNLVNLFVADALGEVPREEVLRVLAPGGVAMIAGRRTVKPRPPGIDEWTHFLHGPDNNALARDAAVGPPQGMHWLAGPRWTRHHHDDKGTYPAIRTVLAGGGRLYYLADETPSSNRRVPSRWVLTARDAFSGVRLWRRPLPVRTFPRRLERLWRGMVADGSSVWLAVDADAPLAAIDGATGRTVRTYPGTEGFSEVILADGVLYLVAADGAVLAVEAGSGRRLWRWEPGEDGPVVPVTLAAAGGKVFVRTARAACCISGRAGRLLWRTPLPGPEKNVTLRYPRERLIVSGDVVLCSYGGKDPKDLDRDSFDFLGSHPRVRDYDGRLAALSAADGRVLWRCRYMPGLESTPGELYVHDGKVWLGPAFDEPRDLHTGEVLAARPVIEALWTTGHHYRCYPGKATSRYIITAKRGVEMIDLAGSGHRRHNWLRGTCRVGVLPCNGLLYAPPHSCGCYPEAKLAGFWAVAPNGAAAGAAPVPDDRRLVKGPAFAPPAAPAGDAPAGADWPTYRHDAARSGAAADTPAGPLRVVWRAEVGAGLGAVTVAEGKVFVPRVDAHGVAALEEASGRIVWRFTAGGRVDTPPTIYRGRALFGCRDGSVYCLRAGDGRLAWRFLAAPARRLAVAEEQVESVWPVHGGVLVREARAYVVAGRSSYLDGGLTLWALDALTGAVRHRRAVADAPAGPLPPPPAAERERMRAKISQNSTDYKTFLAPDRSDAFSMRGALADVLVAEGDSVFLRQQRFDPALRPRGGQAPHLLATAGLLDGTEHNRAYWLLGRGDFRRLPVAYPWLAERSGAAVPLGLMLAFDAETAWGVRRVGRRGDYSGYTAFAMRRPAGGDGADAGGDFAQRAGARRPPRPLWTAKLDFRPRAMVRAGGAVLLGGAAAGEPARGVLELRSAADGTARQRIELSAPPVWDGLAVANGKVFAALEDGSVVCLGR